MARQNKIRIPTFLHRNQDTFKFNYLQLIPEIYFFFKSKIQKKTNPIYGSLFACSCLSKVEHWFSHVALNLNKYISHSTAV